MGGGFSEFEGPTVCSRLVDVEALRSTLDEARSFLSEIKREIDVADNVLKCEATLNDVVAKVDEFVEKNKGEAAKPQEAAKPPESATVAADLEAARLALVAFADCYEWTFVENDKRPPQSAYDQIDKARKVLKEKGLYPLVRAPPEHGVPLNAPPA